jgi:tetratricopeptide (TPR) repeat protein
VSTAPDLARARELRIEGLGENAAGRPTSAVRKLRAALKLLPPAGVEVPREVETVRVSCFLTLAVSEFLVGGLAAAGVVLEQARHLAGEDPELIARWRCQRGLIHGRSGDLATAEAELRVVIDEPHWFTLFERCAMRLNRGMVFFELGRPREALGEFEAASALAIEVGDDRERFMAEHNRGYATYLTGDLPTALAIMAAAEQLPADASRGPSLYDLSRVLQEIGLLDDALEVLDRARSACRPREDRLLRAEIDLERARILRLTGDFGEARTSARAARTEFGRLGAEGPRAKAALTLLDCDLILGRRLHAVLAGALACESVAVRLRDRELRARSVAVAAEAASRLGRPEVARAALRRHPRESFGLVVHLRHVYAAAVTDVASGRSPRTRLAVAARDLTASQAVSGSLDSRAARKVLSLRLASLDVDLAVQRGPTEVLRTLERWTSLDLPVVRPPADPRQAALTEQLRAISVALRDEPDGPAAAARRAESVRLRAELTDLGHAQRQADSSATTLPPLPQALASLASADRDLLWLFPHAEGLWGAGVVGGRRRLARLADLRTCLETSRRLQADLRAAAYARPGPLHEAISASLEADLAWFDEVVVRPWRLRASGLVVVGTHAVSSVPWGMVPSLAGVPVAVARSATEWAGRRIDAAAPSVEVVTGPGLRHADAEARAVASTWPGARLRVGATASELVGALAGADLVHVAAHGQHQPASPLFSSLRLADGEVYAHELPTGEVRASHVVLSACDVGTAQVRPGDEPLGLAHTLLALGVNSVVAAVAPVPDAQTAEVMAAYHAGLARGLASDEALAATRHASAFVVLGSTWRAAAPNP